MATEIICYVCSRETTVWRRNLSELKSQHSKASICEIIQKLLGDFVSSRNVVDASNCICVGCLNQINDYDWTCQKAIEQETALRDVLLSTELIMVSGDNTSVNKNTEDCFNELEFAEEPPIEIDSESYDEIQEPIQQQLTSKSNSTATPTKTNAISISNIVLQQKDTSVLRPQSERHIFIRQGGKVVKVRFINRSSKVQPIGPMALMDLNKETALKGSNGKVFRVQRPPTRIKTTAKVDIESPKDNMERKQPEPEDESSINCPVDDESSSGSEFIPDTTPIARSQAEKPICIRQSARLSKVQAPTASKSTPASDTDRTNETMLIINPLTKEQRRPLLYPKVCEKCDSDEIFYSLRSYRVSSTQLKKARMDFND